LNILFTTQSSGVKIFYHLLQKIEKDIKINKTGFYVAHSQYYGEFISEHPDFTKNYNIVKEWEIIEDSKKIDPDLSIIKKYENQIGDPTLWNVLISDRRIYLGNRATFKQDYKPSFTHDHMLSILQVALQKIDHLLNTIKPDIILSLDPVTFGDYLFYLFAKKRKIPMLFLKTTKIKNYIEFNSGIFGCSSNIYKQYKQYEKNNHSDQWVNEAKEYIKTIENKNIRHEGMILIPSQRAKVTKNKNEILLLPKKITKKIKYYFYYKNDHHIPNQFNTFFNRGLLKPLKVLYHNFRLSKDYIYIKGHEKINYAFFPLQSEPEISSLIWGKAYMNQIETIRNIARSLPVGMKLIIKEHPRAIGYRSYGYYKKILEIPNVILAHPNQEVRPIIQKSTIVITISGFVAFEAVLYKKPSLMLGGPRPFSILPDSMICYNNNINELCNEIVSLIKNYKYKEDSLINYIAATMKCSTQIDYFTTLLKKKARYGDKGINEFEEEIEKLAIYTDKRIKEELKQLLIKI